MSLEFYKNLKPFSHFNDFTRDENYQVVPSDWSIVLTDIVGSTKAVAAGRYKDVNMLGASTIMALINHLQDYEIPFVFGGDGSTVLVPNQLLDKIMPLFGGLKFLSLKKFNLEMRVGVVPVKDILQEGGQIQIAKYQLAEKNCMALFRGGGLSLAEKWIKNQDSNSKSYLISSVTDSAVELGGLSCRWQPLRNQNGLILTMLVQVSSSNQSREKEILSQLIDKIEKRINKKLSALNPVHLNNLKENSLKAGFRRELKFRLQNKKSSISQAIKYIFVFLFSQTVIALRLQMSFWDVKKYVETMSEYADYKKFDDVLRMVLDLSVLEAQEIEKILNEQQRDGLIRFGLARSAEALMTCMMYSVSQNQHIHFIDGGLGGYTLAAQQMKDKNRISL